MAKLYPFIPSGHVLRTMALEKNPKHGILTDNFYFFRVLTFYGLFPLHPEKNGNFEFKWKSWEFVYSIIFVILGATFSGYGVKIIFETVITRSLGFQEVAFFSSFLCFPVLHVIAVLVLIRAKMIEGYFNEWTKFLKRFERVSGKSAPSFATRTCMIIGGIIVGTIMVFFYGMRESIDALFPLQDFRRIFFWGLFYLELWGVGNIYFTTCLLSIVAEGCTRMSTAILNDVLEKSWEQKPLNDQFALWLSLRQMCLNFGAVFWMIYCYVIFWMFAIALPVISLTANALQHGHVGAFLIACVSVYCIHILAALAHRAANAIGNQFEKSLAAAMLERTPNQHLANFLKDVASCPVSINLCGFLTLDHSLIVSISSTLITYLVIIMQFREQI